MIAFPRAVDNQVFFGMCSPARDMSAGYHAVRRHLFTVSVLHRIDNRRLDSVGSLARGGPNVCVCVFKRISSVRRPPFSRGTVLAEADHEEEIIHVHIGNHSPVAHT